MNEEAELRKEFREKGLPRYMEEPVVDYIMRGQPVDDFLFALVTNDLVGFWSYADNRNRRLLAQWVSFFFNCAPGPCWGSRYHYDVWMYDGGLEGGENGDTSL